MRKMLPLLLCILAVTIVFVSCTSEVDGEMATLRLSINSERSRTVGPGDDQNINAITKYSFRLERLEEGSYNEKHVFERDKSDTGLYSMTGIVPGSYKIHVSGINKDGKTVAKTTLTDINLKRGMNSFNVSLSSFNPDVFGNLKVTVNLGSYFSDSSYRVSAKIYPMNGTPVTLALTKSGNTATKTESNLPIGPYRLEVIVYSVKNSVETPIYGKNDVVVIAPDKTTEITVDATGSAIAEGVTVSESIYTSLTGTLSFTKSSGKGFMKLDLNLGTGIPESIYKKDESTNRNLKIEWYAEDMLINTTTEVYNPSKNTFSSSEFNAFYGPANYSAIMYLEGVPGSMGSATKEITYDPSNNSFV